MCASQNLGESGHWLMRHFVCRFSLLVYENTTYICLYEINAETLSTWLIEADDDSLFDFYRP